MKNAAPVMKRHPKTPTILKSIYNYIIDIKLIIIRFLHLYYKITYCDLQYLCGNY